MPTTLSQPLPSFVDRKDEMKRIDEFIKKALRSEGCLLIVRGEPGVGKTRLIQEAAEQARSRGFAVGSGAGFSESIVPYQPWADILREIGLEYILEELPPPKLLALFLLNSKGSVMTKVKLKDVDTVTLRAAETSLKMARAGSKASKGSVVKEGNLTIHVLESQRLLVLRDKKFSIGALIEGREDEAFLDDLKELAVKIELKHGKVLRSKKSKSKSVAPARELLKKLLEGGKYEGIDHARRNPELRRERLFNNIALGIARKAAIKPILIILDDLQWTDPSSLSLLQYVARNTRQSLVFILGAFRTEAGAIRPHLSTVLRKINQEGLSSELDLTGLAREYLRDLANSFLGPHDLLEDFLDQLWTETEGNPLFVREVLHRLENEGAIKFKARVKRLMRPVKELDLPERVRDVIRARLKLLPKEDRELLDAAAVCGCRFTASLVARVAGEEEAKVLNGLNNIARIHGLLQPVGYDFVFNHSTIQEVIHEGLTKETRQTYHREAAQWLELVGGPIEDIAEHYYFARDKRALALLYKAASTAQAKYANEEAIRFYNEALEFEEEKKRKTEVVISLSEIYLITGEYDKAIGVLNHVLELTENRIIKAKIHNSLGIAYLHKGEIDRSLRIYKEALKQIEGEGGEVEAAILQKLGLVNRYQGEYEIALEFYEKSLVISKRILNQKRVSSLLNSIGNIHLYRADYVNALECYNKALKISEKYGGMDSTGVYLGNIGIVHFYQSNINKALDYWQKTIAICEKVGVRPRLIETFLNIGNAYTALGKFDSAEESYEKSISIASRIGEKLGMAIALSNLSHLYNSTGRHSRALETAVKSVEIGRKIKNQYALIESLTVAGESFLFKKEYDEAFEYLEEGLQLSKKMEYWRNVAIIYALIAKIHLQKGDLQKALEFCDQAKELDQRFGHKDGIGNINRIYGMVFLELKQWNKSIKYFEEGIRTFGEIQMINDLALIHFEFGLMWKSKGDFKKAKEHLNKALDIFDKLKLEKKKKKVSAALKSLNAKSTKPR